MNVERVEVVRMGIRALACGPTLVAEGLEYHAECGCTMIFGVRLDNGEKTCGYDVCERHGPHSTEILAEFSGPDAPVINTDIWLAMLLERVG